MQNDLTADRLRHLLSYAPETGLFYWLQDCGTARTGEVAGCVDTHGYVLIGIDGRLFRAHRLAWLHTHGRWPVGDLDHANCDRSDNRLCNLREATRSQNNANCRRRADNTSGLKGVSYNRRRDQWQAYIRKDGKMRHLGWFATRELAAEYRAAAALAQWGEFARAA